MPARPRVTREGVGECAPHTSGDQCGAHHGSRRLGEARALNVLRGTTPRTGPRDARAPRGPRSRAKVWGTSPMGEMTPENFGRYARPTAL